jgi:hypothetical protein
MHSITSKEEAANSDSAPEGVSSKYETEDGNCEDA